jgi:uncharacterized damage-inducible protein DinB
MQSEIAADFLKFSLANLQLMANRISTCLRKLPEEEIWRRGAAFENSPGNLVLHLCGNMRQWILHGVAGQPDVRTRDEEFSYSGGMTREQLLETFYNTLDEVRAVIVSLPHERLTEVIHPQYHECTVLEAIYQIVGHVEHHAGQIILLTKQFVADDLDLTVPRKR